MKLLIITQKVDRNDAVLGFFHRWLLEFAKNFEKITVICLKRGEYSLPPNIKVLSLGKENKELGIKNYELGKRARYVWNFYKYIWRERKNYDTVFVHMNQEYILLGGLIWKILSKKIYMWRNHHAGSFLTDSAAMFCEKVFCTSKFSYTAKYKKTAILPVGVNTEIFKPNSEVKKVPHSILFLARMAPVKKPHILIQALQVLRTRGLDFTASFYGDPMP